MIPIEFRSNTRSIRTLCELHKTYQDRIAELVQSSIDSTRHLEQLEVDQILLEEKIAALNYEVAELGKKVLKPTLLRIKSAAKVHASRGSVKARAKDDQAVAAFPAMDDPAMYEEDEDDAANKNSVGQRLKDVCCTVS
jgi:hypothetical protein